MQERLEQWFHESREINLCFSTSSMPPQMNPSIEVGTRNVRPVPFEMVSGNSQTVRHDAGPAEGIDFTAKPVQKPKKKKHRPKVIKEKKSAKPQKSIIPKAPKDKENPSTGKRKYVRKKVLNTPANQPPSENADVQNKAEPIPARRSLNFGEEDRQGNVNLVSQAPVTQIPTTSEDPQSSIYAVETNPVQVECHWGGTSSSISASVNPVANLRELQANNVSNKVSFDLNHSINQIPSKCNNLMDSSGQFYQSENAPRSDQMVRGYMMPESQVPHPQHTERVSTMQSSNPEREAAIINQMLHGYRVPENSVTPSMHSERNAMNDNLNGYSMKSEYFRFATNQNHDEASFSLPSSCDFPNVLTIGKKREHSAINGPMVSVDMNFEHSNSSRPIYNPHCPSSRTSHFTETCKKMRSDSYRNWLNGDDNKVSYPSAYLPSNWNTNEISQRNSGVCTLADVQRSMALEKSRSYQRTIGFGMPDNDRVARPNMVQQHNKPTLCDTSNTDLFASHDRQLRYFTSQQTQRPENMMNLPGENNIQRIGSYQLQSLGVRPALHYSTERDCIALPDKQSRYLTAEHTQLPSCTANPLIENYTPNDGIPQLQYLENLMVKGSELVPATHNASTHDDTVNNNCVASPDEQIRKTSAVAVGQPISKSARTDHCFLEASRENEAAKPTKKPKARGRPRKEATSGKPKGRGIRTEKVDSAKCVSSRDKHTDLLNSGRISCGSEPSAGITPNATSKDKHNDVLNNKHISCGSQPSAGITPKATMSESERNVNIISSNLEIPDHSNYISIGGSKHIHAGTITEVIALSSDPIDAVIQKLKLLYISKPDQVVAAVSNKGAFGALVPFEGNVKKKRSRAKVNMDPVTALMWNLLMAPDMCDGAEGMDKDKEKWLEEERKVFRGRIDSFIARMHLVQGDRRFSPWKGSVVDSVVGVFLTQNVSDHLSSSAFMSVASKFPVKLEDPEKPAARVSHTPPEQNDNCSGLFGDSVKLQGKFSVQEIITTEYNEGSNSSELTGNFSGDGFNRAAGECSVPYQKSLTGLHENGPSGFVVQESGVACILEAEDGPMEDAISSQNSAVSSQHSPDYLFHRTDPVGFSSLPYFIEEDYIMRNLSNRMASSTTYAEHLPMQDFVNMPSEKFGSSEYQGVNRLPVPGVNKDVMLDLNRAYQPVNTSMSYVQNGQVDLVGVPYGNHLDNSFCIGLDGVHHPNVTKPEASFYQLTSAFTMANKNKTQKADSSSKLLYCMDESLVKESSHFPSEPSQKEGYSPIRQNFQPLTSLGNVPLSREDFFSEHSCSRNEAEDPFVQQHEWSNLQEVCTTRTKQMGGQSGCIQHENDTRLQAKTCENYYFSNLCENQNAQSEVSQVVASDPVRKSEATRKGPLEVPTDKSKGKKVRGQTKKKAYDWENLRKEVSCNGGNKQRSHNTKDSVDWEAVRQADVRDISETIRERGMNNVLAERIKEFLNRLVSDHGSIDLEWLRDLQPDKAKDYLLSIRGLGLKSAECVRLLTLHHMAFPVDTNVARICVRLGWVPLQPLPESLQLHLLELYPMLEHIQKYLWPRLCELDQLTLYELHYQMITFGKVFCTKSKPNCNSCPMRAECKHFASAFASARLSLPGPEEKSLVASEATNAAESCHQTYIDPRPVGQLEWNTNDCRHPGSGNHQPIVEEPSSPEPEPEIAETKEVSIEDFFTEEPDEIPTISLNIKEFKQNLKSYMQANNIEIEDADMSRALVAITPEAASIPTPRLKNVSRLRTEHQVYELPDSHPLLEGFDRRQTDDPCPYLLSIWTPGETAQSTDAPKTFCNSEETGKLCGSSTCFSCSSAREVQARKVRATILIPCRTAMRGSFPLNGTYFQVNELFADHYSSQNPIDVERSLIWNLPRRTVYFGTSIPTIFRGLTTEEIQQCFWRGFVCVRGFDRKLRAPRPLFPRLHFPASKVTRDKRHAAAREDE